jgi:hypothetical protein
MPRYLTHTYEPITLNVNLSLGRTTKNVTSQIYVTHPTS